MDKPRDSVVSELSIRSIESPATIGEDRPRPALVTSTAGLTDSVMLFFGTDLSLGGVPAESFWGNPDFVMYRCGVPWDANPSIEVAA